MTVPFSKVSVLVPTRQRPERLRTMIASFEETTRDCADSAELIFRVDEDDATTLRHLLAPLRYEVIVGPRYDGYASLSTFFNEMAAVATGDVLFLGNDDMVFKTHGWPTKVIDTANRYPDGIFVIGYDTLNSTHYPFSTISRRVVNHLGYFWPPGIFWGDIFWRDVMGAFKRTIMLPHVAIEHDWAGFNPDQVFKESNKVEPTAYWSTTHADAVAAAVDKLRLLVLT